MLELERALVAAILGETSPAEAANRMCAALARLPGVTCTLLEGHEPRSPQAPDDGTAHLLFGTAAHDTARTLVITHGGGYEPSVLDPAMLERTKRIFERVLELPHPSRQRERAIHEVNNRLAGLAANLELMELLIAEIDTSPSDEPRRRELATAAGYALASCRALHTAIRALAGPPAPRATARADEPSGRS